MRPTRTIVVKGPYRFTRNPMYVALSVAYLGIALIINSVWSLVFLPFVVLLVDRYVIHREESYLVRKFGTEYDAYRGRVRRWL